MSISNFTVSSAGLKPNVIRPNSSFNVQFTLKHDMSSNYKMTNVEFFVWVRRSDSTTAYSVGSADVSIAKGASAAVNINCMLDAERVKDIIDSTHVMTSVKCGFCYSYSGGLQILFPDEQLLPASSGLSLLFSSYNPVITTLTARRYTDNPDEPSDEGEKLTLTYAMNADGNYSGFALTASATNGSSTYDLSSNVTKPSAGATRTVNISDTTKKFLKGSDWTITLTLSDTYEIYQLSTTVGRAFANLHMSGQRVGGVCIGGFSSVTETDLDGKFECYFPAYFYGGIAFGGAGNYSTIEQDTGGKWVDGKPIYRQTFVQLGVAGKSADTTTTIADISWLNIDKLIRLEGCALQDNGTSFNIPTYYSTSIHKSAYITSTSLIFRHNENSTSRSNDVYITLYYTKTTDRVEV